MSLLDRLKQLFAEAKTAPATLEPVAPVAVDDPTEPDSRPDRRKKKRINAVAGTRVLIVDDSPTIVALLSRMLKQNQYTVLEAGDGESALEIARRERPGLIFLDIVLPGMSGFTALRTLRHDPVTKDIPIVMISGNAQATEQFYVQRIGADNFMKKPFSRAEVFTYIERLLDENLVPRRFNTFVHDTTLEPEVEEVEEVEQSGVAVTETDAGQTTSPAPESAAIPAAAPAAVAEVPAAAEAAMTQAAQPSAAIAQTTTSTAAEPVATTEPATKTEPAASAESADASANAPVATQGTLSFAEMVEALLDSTDDSEIAPSDSTASAAAEPSAPPAPEPPARDIFADINAGWRRPAARTPPPG